MPWTLSMRVNILYTTVPSLFILTLIRCFLYASNAQNINGRIKLSTLTGQNTVNSRILQLDALSIDRYIQPISLRFNANAIRSLKTDEQTQLRGTVAYDPDYFHKPHSSIRQIYLGGFRPRFFSGDLLKDSSGFKPDTGQQGAAIYWKRDRMQASHYIFKKRTGETIGTYLDLQLNEKQRVRNFVLNSELPNPVWVWGAGFAQKSPNWTIATLFTRFEQLQKRSEPNLWEYAFSLRRNFGQKVKGQYAFRQRAKLNSTVQIHRAEWRWQLERALQLFMSADYSSQRKAALTFEQRAANFSVKHFPSQRARHYFALQLKEINKTQGQKFIYGFNLKISPVFSWGAEAAYVDPNLAQPQDENDFIKLSISFLPLRGMLAKLYWKEFLQLQETAPNKNNQSVQLQISYIW